MRLRVAGSVLALLLFLAAGAWFGWQYLQFRSCGERTCPPLADRAPLTLDSGETVALLATRLDERGRLVVDYLTERDRLDRAALCEQARAVWDAAQAELDTRRVEDVVLGPTSPDSEFLGMRYGVVPLYTCCVTTPIRVEKTRAGAWTFPDCPTES